MIQAIYTDRNFVVKDDGCTSSRHRQEYGISQGCPLSPFLFIVLMTVLMHDARGTLMNEYSFSAAERLLVSELVYADDTLIVDTDECFVQEFMSCIGEAGNEYGLNFNWSKLEAMPVRTTATIRKPDGSTVDTKPSLTYLGCYLSNDGRLGSELGRRLGLAKCDFANLSRAWGHTSMGRQRKFRILDACVISKLTYGF